MGIAVEYKILALLLASIENSMNDRNANIIVFVTEERLFFCATRADNVFFYSYPLRLEKVN